MAIKCSMAIPCYEAEYVLTNVLENTEAEMQQKPQDEK